VQKLASTEDTAERIMVREQIRARGVRDPRVLGAMAEIPRAEFVPPKDRYRAYEDRPLPIGGGQTISQPYMVALMIEALSLRGNETVLDVGAGSGYQTAILARLAARLYAIEREAALIAAARETLTRLHLIDRVTLVEGDGSLGHAPGAPYDAIVVGAGAPDVPPALIEQLAEGGRLVIPVGSRVLQDLVLVRKSGGVSHRVGLGGCQFVPLRGEQGWDRR
jgi:protein-L-isoaspartate(D-aspartate) O-methyltransferase